MRKTVVFFLLFSVLSALPVFGADSTSFDPTRVVVTAKGSGGVPVGTIIAWPVATNPDDMDNWLECNGQSVNPSVYPELSAVIGLQVPDLRGLFLRGMGGNSANLGVRQEDAIRNISGSFTGGHVSWPVTGAFRRTGVAYLFRHGGDQHTSRFEFDASLQVPTAEENRPVNMAVRYLIRARP